MRCRKARYWNEGPEDLSRDQQAHLEKCRWCRRYIQAARWLDKSFQVTRAEMPVEPTPLPVLKIRVAARRSRKEYSFMSKFRNAWSAHPRFSLGLAVGIAALIFFVLVPLPYQRTSGYSVEFGGVDRAEQIDMKQVAVALKAVGLEKVGVNVSVSGDKGNVIFTNLPTRDAVRRTVAVFASLAGTSVEPTVVPKVEVVSGSLYAQVKDKIVKVEIDGKGKTDEQIRAEIESQLAAQGFTGSVIYLKTDSTGQRQIRMELKDGGNDSSGGSPTTVQVDTRGKTREQIEAEIKARLAEQGHPDAQVNITESGSDSLKKVEIKIETTPANK